MRRKAYFAGLVLQRWSPGPVLGTLLAGLALGAATAGPADPNAVNDVVQTLADLTLIDGVCQALSVNFGMGFSFATEHGVDPAALMPAGSLRKLFEADLQRSRALYSADITCGALAEHYSVAVPGSVTLPPSGRRDDS